LRGGRESYEAAIRRSIQSESTQGYCTEDALSYPDVALIVIHMMHISVGPTAGPASELGNRATHTLVKSRGNWELAGFANVPILTPAPAIHDAEETDVIYAAPIP